MQWIYYNLLTLHDGTRQVKPIVSVVYGCHLSFQFTREIRIKKFEVHSFKVELQDVIKRRTIPLYINVSIWWYIVYSRI